MLASFDQGSVARSREERTQNFATNANSGALDF